MRRALAATLALLSVLFVVASIRYAPPPPRPRSADPATFSAERARDVQARLSIDGETRWVGTEGNARGRKVLASALTEIGFTVEEQTSTACTHFGTCARVVNVVAVLEGREPALPGVLLSSHHDSVPASPGASDDAVGAAALVEVGRALAAGERPRRTIVILVTDGEEAGLLGADAFARSHALAGKVRYAVNVDARGSRGPSQLFETSQNNAWLIDVVASKLSRPVTSSLFYEVYRRLPNDTDFSITKTLASGVNFANTAGIEHYHTPLDRLDNASLGTLQHHGDHVLDMARAFAATSGAGPRDAPGDAVWFDVLALALVHWPASWSPLLGLLAAALILGRALRARLVDRGLLALVAILAAGAVPGMVVARALKVTLAAPFVAHPTPLVVALDATVLGGALAAGLALARRANPRTIWTGVWLGWALIGAALGWLAPGVSYVFIAPALVAAIAGSLPPPVAGAAPAVAAGVVLFALERQIYDAVGFFLPLGVTIPWLLLASTLAPMLSGLPERATPIRIAAGLATVAAIGLGVFALRPTFSADVPQRVNVIVREDEKGTRAFVDASWGAAYWGSPPEPMVAALGPVGGRERAVSWTLEAPWSEHEPLGLGAPELSVLDTKTEGDRKKLKVRVRSTRGASSLALFFPRETSAPAAPVLEAKVDGRFAPLRALPGGALLALFAVPTEGFVVELDAPAAPLPVTLSDRTLGVPAGSKAAAAADARRALGTAAASQDGDQTVVTRTLSL